MSVCKESYIGGDYIEITGGSCKVYAKDNINNISVNGPFGQNGLKNGVLYATNGQAPIIGAEDLDFYVDIFRSNSQNPDNFGKKDSDYKGTFGFDRYNENTSGKGKQSVSGFDVMHFNGIKYYTPWISLWPPKQNLQSISEIDSNYNPVTSAVLVLKVLPGKTSNGNAKIFISSDNLNIKIDNNDSVTKETSINGTIIITVSCVGVLEKDAKIEIKQNDQYGIVVGKLKIIKNNVVYIANTKFITVIEEEQVTNNEKKLQKREAEKKEFQNLIKDVITYLNTNSLNQSLIYIKGTVEDIFVIDKGEIKRNAGEGVYSNSITIPYFEGKHQDKAIDDTKETKEERELDKAIKNLYNALNKNYNKYKKNTYYCSDTVNNTDQELFKIYEEKYQAYLNTLTGNQKIGGKERRNDTIYVFIDKNQETLDIGGFSYYGYTLGADNVAFVFNKHVKERKFGTFAHEIAHSLGLDHTFELRDKEYRSNKTLDADIIQKEKLLKEKQQNNSPQVLNNSAVNAQTRFTRIMEKNLHYPIVQKPEQISANFGGSKEKYYLHISSMFSSLKLLANSEGAVSQSQSQGIDPVASLQSDINELKTKRQANENKYIDVDISATQENFMDYDYDSNNTHNPNFEPKSLWYWQWKELQNSKFLIKKVIK
ncbi:M12 family metallo-peptidase [Chryseobacterium arthrosphaerae]|uniref:Uncharacterized protein n=1 Tax=Chryseobacterium arthrosphaerae TaxID=651561 RepID=A0A1B8ZF99_9FLAO|nr:M12 family metallo-peptidase [Chryseobacterium arthrosphaerae]OCA70263.1 hypothetical protein BBI00_20760 [Chryseobacterium arthrosphaerae]WES97511.1 M43 family zinc metalloprotease [Chryseobacterium arthrosphaerae]